MTKRLVISCDGTWDRPLEFDQGRATCTNVHKLHAALAETDAAGDAQVPCYHIGVGTGGALDRGVGGLFGVGLAKNVKACYRFIVEHYEPGALLYFFGFSRGAFTARSTAGMVRNCGILRREHLDRLDEGFALYRNRSARTRPGGDPARTFRERYSHPDERIHFVGVWDTVGSLGVPFPIPFWRRLWGFHDTRLSDRVSNAFQAVAIDEHRRPFTPTLWTRKSEPDGQRLEQVWFAGSHRDIGGGHAEGALADITLLWMVERARECGLRFAARHFAPVDVPVTPEEAYAGSKLTPDPLGELHDSFKGFYKLLLARWRDIPFASTKEERPHSREAVAQTAELRAQLDASYKPPRLQPYLDAGLPTTRVTNRRVQRRSSEPVDAAPERHSTR